jgi:hypothetical protein
MDPSIDDVADTISATYRALSENAASMQSLVGALWAAQIMLAFLAGIVALYVLRKVMNV